MSIGLSVQPNKKLTKDVAIAIAKVVSTTGSIAPRDAKMIDLSIKDSVTGVVSIQTFSVQTIRTWTSRNTSIIGTNRGFGDFIESARNDYRKAKQITENSLLLQKARRNAVEMLNMDTTADGGFVGITSKRDPKTGKRIEVQRYKQKYIGTDAIKLKEKASITLKVLEKLDPAFKKESETTVNVNLSFLALADKRQEMLKLGKIKSI